MLRVCAFLNHPCSFACNSHPPRLELKQEKTLRNLHVSKDSCECFPQVLHGVFAGVSLEVPGDRLDGSRGGGALRPGRPGRRRALRSALLPHQAEVTETTQLRSGK